MKGVKHFLKDGTLFTGKTHKQGCRYYGQGKGRHAKKASGNDCKICGGARLPFQKPL